MTHTIHSYSGIKDFQNCPRKYHQTRVLKLYRQGETEATRYGTEVHKAFEDFVRDGQPLPDAFRQFQEFVDPLVLIPGTRYCEHKLGVRADYSPCEFFAEDAWFRGIPDLLIVNSERGIAHVADYKTGKSSRYADPAQLELLAAMIMSHFPEVNRVRGALLFVVARAVLKYEYTRDQLPAIWASWTGHARNISKAHECGVWNARPSGLCKFCPLPESACEHR